MPICHAATPRVQDISKRSQPFTSDLQPVYGTRRQRRTRLINAWCAKPWHGFRARTSA